MPEIVYWYFSFLCFCFGACVGSFLNVCVYRIPQELSVVAPRSYCPHCKAGIAWYDNVPLLSFLMLRARCRKCGARISPRYFLIELLTAVLFLVVWLKYDQFGGLPLGLAPLHDNRISLVFIYWLATGGLLLGTFVDLEHMIIPDRVTIGGVIAGLILSTIFPEMHGQSVYYHGLARSAIGAAVGGGMLWGVAVVGSWIFKKEAMGMGDVKLLAAIGAFLGWASVLFCIVFSSFVGAIVGVSLVISRRKAMQSRIPFGPYLALAAQVWMLWGPVIVAWYLNLLLWRGGTGLPV